MENEKLFELMQSMYEEMKEGFKRLDNKIELVDDKIDEMHKDLNTLTMRALAQNNNLIDLIKKIKT